jgi:hypothetical protein
LLTLGADPAAPTPAPPAAPSSLANIPPAAQMILPGAVVALVDRKKHPIVFWVFGVIPLTGGVATAIIKRRLF